ncbi:MAG: radical SAM protein [Chloroflexota bacterium]|nr:radical SAM protein [Chloroflexota bacterium]
MKSNFCGVSPALGYRASVGQTEQFKHFHPTPEHVDTRSVAVRAGRIDATLIEARSIFTPASGFMADWDYTLNAYSGCGFGCNYCYAAFFARDPQRRDTWGDWVDIKQNAVALIHRFCRRKQLTGKSIYMSSVTDPYQPVERRLELTREILRTLQPEQPRLAVQTRSPLVTRDIDVLKRFDVAQVNMTVTTDSETVSRAFEPHCPRNGKRLAAIAEIVEAGIDAGITMTPLLPVDSPERFASDLVATGVERFVVQPFHPGKGRFVRGTGPAAVALADEMRWTEDRYLEVVQVLRAALPGLQEGRTGFAPPE